METTVVTEKYNPNMGNFILQDMYDNTISFIDILPRFSAWLLGDSNWVL
jgi:hypothetical protein